MIFSGIILLVIKKGAFMKKKILLMSLIAVISANVAFAESYQRNPQIEANRQQIQAQRQQIKAQREQQILQRQQQVLQKQQNILQRQQQRAQKTTQN